MNAGGVIRSPIAAVVRQHADDAAALRVVRSVLVRAPHVRLRHLARLDERIAAHLDGLAVAGTSGTAVCTAALDSPGPGQVFAAAIRAIEDRDDRSLHRLIALSVAVLDCRRGLVSAFGWASAATLRGLVQSLLAAKDPEACALGLAACRLHRVDPGSLLRRALDGDALVTQEEALRTASMIGRTDCLDGARRALSGPQPSATAGAVAACLLGDRGDALAHLQGLVGAGTASEPVLCLAILASSHDWSRSTLRKLVDAGRGGVAANRRAIRAAGWSGDVAAIPWLLAQLADDQVSRLAAESVSLITGVDLAALGLERKPPSLAGAGDSGGDEAAVGIADDESLPWPDPERVNAWWRANADRMPAPVLLLGGVPGRQQCELVLRDGLQRQRLIAAVRLKLFEPEAAMFNVAAPSWRQQRLLSAP
ncbi:MAG TPA: TIGR02270 family protein [Caldimonas sp.]|jgi:uncharacterized protein (TIGR02270 family)|nr:TIGR02270 family protein [Caldimonas sp.]HEV7575704.1 TIGR02270 family protein [Caldimonas sp.]